MEVSSQALKYHRSLCTDFAATCFLNIGYDHISPIEHPDFEDYFSSKLKIFAQGAVNCVNLDCDHADRVLKAAQECGKIITCEEHNILGGLGEAVCGVLAEKCPTPVRRIGVNDEFGHSGPAAALLKQFGLCADHIVEVAKDFCGK